MTAIRTYATERAVSRNKVWEKRLTLPLTSETVERLDAVREPGEDRLSIIRSGIEAELKRRERATRKSKPD